MKQKLIALAIGLPLLSAPITNAAPFFLPVGSFESIAKFLPEPAVTNLITHKNKYLFGLGAVTLLMIVRHVINRSEAARLASMNAERSHAGKIGDSVANAVIKEMADVEAARRRNGNPYEEQIFPYRRLAPDPLELAFEAAVAPIDERSVTTRPVSGFIARQIAGRFDHSR